MGLIKNGHVTRPHLGITYVGASEVGGDSKGLYVMNIEKGSPAQKAGMIGTTMAVKGKGKKGNTIGDLIVAINEDEIESDADMMKALAKYKPGDTINIKVKRSTGERKMDEVELKLTLGSKETKRKFRLG